MRDLFIIDSGDYNPSGKVISRPSARAVIHRDGKVLLIYSQKYSYYKFPGGGIRQGESPEEALVREVREEAGVTVIPESIEEYGRVLRRQKDSYDESCIFEQENLYYFCEITDDTVDTELDDYEAEEGFTPVWVEAVEASRFNYHQKHDEGADPVLIKREAKVLDLVDIEIRKRERLQRNSNGIS